MKFLNPTLLALLGAGFCCGEGQEECSEPNRKLEQYDGGNQGVGQDNQWDGRKNRWIGNRNAIKGDKNNLVGDNNQVRGRSNWVSGQSNDINGKRNTVKGRGNVIHGRGNVVSNTFGEDLDFDIESRFPAWMRSTSKDKKKKDKKKKAMQPRYIETNEGTEEERPWTRRNWPFGDDENDEVEQPRRRVANWQRPKRTQNRWQACSESSDRSSPLRQSLRKRIQQQIEREFGDYQY